MEATMRDTSGVFVLSYCSLALTTLYGAVLCEEGAKMHTKEAIGQEIKAGWKRTTSFRSPPQTSSVTDQR